MNILHKKDAHSMEAAAFLSVHHEYSNSYLTHFHSVCVCVFCIGFEWSYLIFFWANVTKVRARIHAHTHRHARALTSYKHTNGPYMQCWLALNARKMQKNTLKRRRRRKKQHKCFRFFPLYSYGFFPPFGMLWFNWNPLSVREIHSTPCSRFLSLFLSLSLTLSQIDWASP